MIISFLKIIDSGLDKICSWLLTLAVAGMLLLTLMNIGLRWVGESYLWVEPLVRHFVFFSAFLGGAIATGKNSHIGIDVISKIFEAREMKATQSILKSITSFASFVVLVFLVKTSYDVTLQEIEWGREEFLGIHSSVLIGSMPLGIAIIAFRFFIQFHLSLLDESVLGKLGSFDNFLDKIAGYLLTGAVAGMLILTLVNIVLRWFGQSFLWVEPLVRHLVFFSAFLGGSIATGKGNHIGIDILSKIFEARNSEKSLETIKSVAAFASFITIMLLMIVSYEVTLQEFEFGRAEFLGIHSGILVGSMPVGLAIIGFRFFYQYLLTQRAYSTTES